MLKCHLNAEKNMKKWEWKKTCAAPRRQSVFVHVTWTKCHNLLPAMLSQAWFSFSLSRYALLIRDDQKGVTSPAKVCCLYILASAIRFWGILSTVLTSIGLLVQKYFLSAFQIKRNFEVGMKIEFHIFYVQARTIVGKENISTSFPSSS